MTTLAVIVGVDSRGPASIYIATDSRVSVAGSRIWDGVRKAFASAQTPAIFAYAGAVLFPSLVLSQFAELIKAELVPSTHEALLGFMRAQGPALPDRTPFAVVHCWREGSGLASRFRTAVVDFDGTSFSSIEAPSPLTSDFVLEMGSGRQSVEDQISAWRSAPSVGTTRHVFAAVVAAIQSDRDPLSGGAPQLVGLYRIGNGRTVGVVTRTGAYFLGAQVDPSSAGPEIEWRNELFERANPLTGTVLPGAQRHGRIP